MCSPLRAQGGTILWGRQGWHLLTGQRTCVLDDSVIGAGPARDAQQHELGQGFCSHTLEGWVRLLPEGSHQGLNHLVQLWGQLSWRVTVLCLVCFCCKRISEFI